MKLWLIGGNDYLEVMGGSDNFFNGNKGQDMLDVCAVDSGSWVNGRRGEDYVTGSIPGVIYRGGRENDLLVVSQGDVFGDKGADTFWGVLGDG